MNKRQKRILNILYSAERYLTYAEIAEQLSVSVKTVRNDVAALKEYLSENTSGTIETKPHAGIRLQTDGLFDSEPVFGDDEREIEFCIIRSLLKDGHMTTVQLTQEYFIGRGAADRISDTVAAKFAEHRILYERRRGKGIMISFSEFNYRMARMAFYFEYMSMYEKISSKLEDPCSCMPSREYTAMTAALNGFQPIACEKAICETEKQFGFHYNFDALLSLVFLISLSVIRTKEGKIITLPTPSGKNLGGTSAEVIGKALADRLESECNVILPDSERHFINLAVGISEIESFDSDDSRRAFETMNIKLCSLTVRIVSLISKIAGVDLRDDSFFVKHMFMQLKATIPRLRFGIIKKNPLLSQIKANYPNIMAVAWLLQNVLEKELNVEINEHEIGFIALHIGSAIERKLSGPSACIVCDYGVGISHILKERITRIFPEIKITSVFSGRDIYKIKREQCDFIITTISLEDYRLNHEVVYVSHLMDERDIKKLENVIKSINRKKPTNIKIHPKTELISSELVFTFSGRLTKKELLSEMCSKLMSLGYVTEGFEKSVLERENTAPTDIGGKIAFPHGHSKYVNHSVVAVAKLKNPIEWNGNGDFADLVFLAAFDLDESTEIKEKIIEFYQSFVSFTENKEECDKLRKLDNSKEIYNFIKQW